MHTNTLWSEHFDETHQAPYWMNAETDDATWEKPEGFHSAPPLLPSAEVSTTRGAASGEGIAVVQEASARREGGAAGALRSGAVRSASIAAFRARLHGGRGSGGVSPVEYAPHGNSMLEEGSVSGLVEEGIEVREI